MKYNVAVQLPDCIFLLTLDGFRTYQEAALAINWQRKGDFWHPMYIVSPRPEKLNTWRVHIVTRSPVWHPDDEACRRVLSNWAGVIRPIKGAWTREAWAKMLHRYWPAQINMELV